MMSEPEYINPPAILVCGFEISSGDLEDHVELINSWVNAERGGWIVTLNTEMLSRARLDSGYKKLLSSADLFLADGMPIVWAANKKKVRHKIRARTTGVDLVDRLFLRDEVIPFAVIGGVDPERAINKYQGASEKCMYMFDGVVNLESSEVKNYAQKIQASGARILLLALGVPKQDVLAQQLRNELPTLIIIGVGGTMEILSSDVGRSPVWMQSAGLEWLYRFSKDRKDFGSAMFCSIQSEFGACLLIFLPIDKTEFWPDFLN